MTTEDAIRRTAAAGTPRLEVGRHAPGGAAGQVIVGVKAHRDRVPELVFERATFTLGGYLGIVAMADGNGIIASESDSTASATDPVRVVTENLGFLLATDQRIVGQVVESPPLLTTDPDDFVIWELPFDDMVSITLEREQRGSRVADLGFHIQALRGRAEGAVALARVETVTADGNRTELRDLPNALAPLITAIFDHLEATASTDEHRQTLQAARREGWQPDPDEAANLVVFFPTDPARAAAGPGGDTRTLEPESTPSPSGPTAAGMPPADWYADPDDPTSARYWNGAHWTQATTTRPDHVGSEQ